MATVYEDLIAKAVAKGIDPAVAAAAAEQKLSKEGRSLIEMSEEAPAAPAAQSRQALIRKATAKGISPQVAMVAAEQKIDRDVQKALERAETFEQGYSAAKAADVPDPGFGEVFAGMLTPRAAPVLPAIGEADAASVYAMPPPRPMGDPTGVVTLGRGAYVPRKPPAPKPQYNLRSMEELTPEQRLDVEAVRREESIRRAQAAQQQGREFAGTLGPAATVVARALGTSPAGAATMMLAPELVGLAGYGYERLATPNEPSVMEMLIRGKPGTTAAGSRPQGASDLLSMQLTEAGTPTPMLPSSQTFRASLLPTDAEQKAFLEQRARAGQGTLEEQAAARLRTVVDAPSITGTGLSEVGGRIMNAGSTLASMGRDVSDLVGPAADAYKRKVAQELLKAAAVVPELQKRVEQEKAKAAVATGLVGGLRARYSPESEAVARRQNALLAEANPQKYVPVGPSNDPYQQLASSPEDALLTNPVAFEEWAKLYPAEAQVARDSVAAQRGALPSLRVPGAAKPLNTDELVSLVRAGPPVQGAPQGIAEGLRLALAEGDVAQNVRDFASDPTPFYEKAAQFDLDESLMPAADFLKGLRDDEYLALAAFGDGIRDDAGRILLAPSKSETVRTLLGLRKTDPERYRTYIDAIIEGQNQ